MMYRSKKNSPVFPRVSLALSKTGVLLIICMAFAMGSTAPAQQKGQWVPGQAGLNAGVLPGPGLTYANLSINYSADTLKDEKGNSIPVQGTYSFWAIESVVYYVPKAKVLGGTFAFQALLPIGNGSFTLPAFGVDAGGAGYADTWIQPVTLGWNLKRADTWVAYAFTAPTGRFTSGSTSNVGSGYWGNNLVSGTTFYLTKNKKTTANLATDWEIHCKKSGTNVTPGQAFTMEWGVGQLLPLDQKMTRLLQLGVIGLRPMAGDGGRRHPQRRRSRSIGALLLGSCRWDPGKLHASGEECELLLQVRTGVSCLCPSARANTSLRRSVDLEFPARQFAWSVSIHSGMEFGTLNLESRAA